MLHHYSTIAEEVQHRINARVAGYEITPPKDLLETLGPKPADPKRSRRWLDAAAVYAEARLNTGPNIDLTDPKMLHAPQWRDAMFDYHEPPTPPAPHPGGADAAARHVAVDRWLVSGGGLAHPHLSYRELATSDSNDFLLPTCLVSPDNPRPGRHEVER